MKKRDISIKCDFTVEINNLFHYFSSQLSDGYWENSGGQWATYKDKYYADIWNCFEFFLKCAGKRDYLFIIRLKSKPTYKDATEDCEKMHSWSDQQIVDYLKDALIDSIDEAPSAFSCYSDFELETFTKVMNNWKIIPPEPPKMTHEDLVKLVGHDFTYVE